MRLDKLRQAISTAEEGLDALLIYQPYNRRYISGFTGSEGMIVVTPASAVLAVDSRYWDQAERQAPEFKIYQVKTRFPDEMTAILAAAGNPRRVGFESDYITVAQLNQLSESMPDVEWVETGGMVQNLRTFKDEREMAAIRRAAQIADEGFEFLRRTLRPGMTESDVAWELEVYMRTHGAEALAFDTIVGGGPNGAEPHHLSGSRPIQAGEPIVLDFGARVDGYNSDMTRTVCLGQPADSRFMEIYTIVLRAQEAALHGIRGGISSSEADRLARSVIEQAGYGDYFGHGLGHGVGLEIHELPRASRLADTPIPAGSALTVEPGIYLPGWGGVRIEDLCFITENGVELASHATKEPLIL